MADAPKLVGTDTLRIAYPKINSSIDNANTALTKSATAETNSTNAVNTANSAVTTADSVQEQFNQVVIEGDSSVEAAQARVNKDGSSFTTLKDRLDNSDEQLADIDTQISNIGNASPKGVYATLSALQTAFPTGNTNIYLVTADGKWYYWNGSAWVAGGTYQSTGIADGSVTQNKLDRLYVTGKIGKNLFNKDTVTVGKYVEYTNGNLVTNAPYSASDYILVTPSKSYAVSGTVEQAAWYDINKVYISGISGFNSNGGIVTSPSNAYYIRLTMMNTQVSTVQIEQNTIKTAYESFRPLVDSSLLIDKTIPFGKLKYPIKYIASKNLFDKTDITSGKYIDYVTGNLATNATYSASNYIEIKPSTNYVLSGSYEQLAFYDLNKVYISGVLDPKPYVTAPANAAYVRLSIYNSKIDITQFEEGQTATNFNDYFAKIDRTSIQDIEQRMGFISPSNVYLLDNKELWCYEENIVENAHIFEKLSKKIKVESTVAGTYTIAPDRFVLKGTANNATTLSLLDYSSSSISNKTPQTLASKSINIVSKAYPTGKTINTLIIGDSFIQYTFGDGILKYINSLAVADGNTIAFKGTKTVGGGYSGEGRGGWTEHDYLTLYIPIAQRDPLANNENKKMPSPFVFSDDDTVANSYFSMSKYLTDNAITNVDNVVFFLGMNGGDGSDINTMIAKMKEALPNANYFVCIVPNTPKFSDNLSYVNIDLQISRDEQNKSYLTKFEGRESENVYVIPTHLNVSRLAGIENHVVNKYQFSDLNTDTDIVNTGIHPTALGAKSIAYIIYNYLAYFNA